MVSKRILGGLVAPFFALGMVHAQAADVTITPLGNIDHQLCWYDRAMLFQDPSGVNILIQPGRTVREGEIAGSVHVILLDHAHGDHLGDVRLADGDCGGTAAGATSLAPDPSTARIAAEKNSVVLAGGELAAYLAQRLDALGEKGGDPNVNLDCGAETSSPSLIEGNRVYACAGVVRPGATREITLNGTATGVRISTIQATHSNGIPPGLTANPGAFPAGTSAYGGTETGFIIRFSNGLTVLWSGDSGFFGDMRLFSQYYGVNLAIMHIGDVFTMGPNEAAFAVNHLIKPRSVIPTHVNENATLGTGKVQQGTKTAQFISRVKGAKVIVPTSGDVISCDGKGRCKKN